MVVWVSIVDSCVIEFEWVCVFVVRLWDDVVKVLVMVFICLVLIDEILIKLLKIFNSLFEVVVDWLIL